MFAADWSQRPSRPPPPNKRLTANLCIFTVDVAIYPNLQCRTSVGSRLATNGKEICPPPDNINREILTRACMAIVRPGKEPYVWFGR